MKTIGPQLWLACLLLGSCYQTPQRTTALATTNDAQVIQAACGQVPNTFRTYVDSILRDQTDLFHGSYPEAPPLRCEMLVGLQQELQTPETRREFERLSRANWGHTAEYTEAITALAHSRQFYTVLALLTHFSHDVKILALQAYRVDVQRRPLLCTVQAEYDRLARIDRHATRFLHDVLTGNPRFIVGRENATVHDHYMRTLMLTLDLLTREHITETDGGDGTESILHNEQLFQRALNRWETHVRTDQ